MTPTPEKTADFINRNFDHVKLVCENALLPIHLMLNWHHYTLATTVACIMMAVYTAATVLRARSYAKK